MALSGQLLEHFVARFRLSQQIGKDGDALAFQLRAVLSAHGAWKNKLATTIDSGKSEADLNVVALDDRCPFGQWLHNTISTQHRSNSHYQPVHDLDEHAAEVVCVDSDQPRECCREPAKGAPANNLGLVGRVQRWGSGCPSSPVVMVDRDRTSPSVMANTLRSTPARPSLL